MTTPKVAISPGLCDVKEGSTFLDLNYLGNGAMADIGSPALSAPLCIAGTGGRTEQRRKFWAVMVEWLPEMGSIGIGVAVFCGELCNPTYYLPAISPQGAYLSS
jgi:hypothetical protein